jgi:hypothetical protein
VGSDYYLPFWKLWLKRPRNPYRANLNLQALIPSQNQLIKGGSPVVWQPFQQGLNVIQAASETGVNGTVNVSSPQFNISGSMSGLDTNNLELPVLSPNPCQDSVDFASSLVRGGKGGIPNNEEKEGFIPAAIKLQSEKYLSEIKKTITQPVFQNNKYACVSI